MLIKLIIYLLSIITPGYLLALVIFKYEKINFLTKIALAYCLGGPFITIQLFVYLFLLKLTFSFKIFWLILLIEILILFILVIKFRFVNLINLKNILTLNKFDFQIREIIVLFLILLQFIFIFSSAFNRPVITYDSMAMWSLKSKILYFENKIIFDPVNDFLYLGGGGHRNYPWHIPLVQFWLHYNLGEYDELFINLIFVAYFISVLILIYFFLNFYLSKFKSLIFIFLFSSMPLIFYHSFNAYADLPLGCYVFIAFVFFYMWLEKNNNNYLLLSSVFWAISFWVKDTAIIYFIPFLVMGIILFYLKFLNKKEVLKFIIPLLIITLPWTIFKLKYNLGLSNVDGGLVFHPEILYSLIYSLFINNSWNIWFYIVFILFIINHKKIKRDRNMLIGWLYITLVFLGISILYIFTNRYAFAIDQTALSRNILVIIPITVFLIGVLFKDDGKIYV